MKTRLRRLHVNGRTCTWTASICHIPGELDCHRGIRLRVWGSGKNGQALQADLLSKTQPGPWGACATDDAYPTSGDVRAVIDYALTHGWQPNAVGGTFPLTESAHAATFDLPDFLLTDRLQNPNAPDPTARVLALA